ncbi:MAG: PH domain-containing protein [Haloquadratum sp.]|jgi:membrane protein YdbS with pleckstrin-like domain|nr:PH domain-containing protein [Haloferacaceae archaeon]MDR9445561.1 PH domain-containing protein [Haloquadratum sp.]
MDAAREEAHALDPRVRWRWLLRGMGPLVVIAAVATAAVWMAPITLSPVVATGGVLIGGVSLWTLATYLRYRRWRYRLEADGLTLTHGVLTHVQTVVPYTRIQHVDTQRGPLDRLLGLGAVVVYTAGTRGADVSIPGLASEEADRMRERLRDASARTAGEDAV